MVKQQKDNYFFDTDGRKFESIIRELEEYEDKIKNLSVYDIEMIYIRLSSKALEMINFMRFYNSRNDGLVKAIIWGDPDFSVTVSRTIADKEDKDRLLSDMKLKDIELSDGNIIVTFDVNADFPAIAVKPIELLQLYDPNMPIIVFGTNKQTWISDNILFPCEITLETILLLQKACDNDVLFSGFGEIPVDFLNCLTSEMSIYLKDRQDVNIKYATMKIKSSVLWKYLQQSKEEGLQFMAEEMLKKRNFTNDNELTIMLFLPA